MPLTNSHANTQLRITLSHILLNFDLEAQPDNTDPHNLLEYGTWQVQPLKLRVKEVRRRGEAGVLG